MINLQTPLSNVLLKLPAVGIMKTIHSGRQLDLIMTAPYVCENEVAAEMPI